MHRLIKVILSLPKTLWFNFRYLPLPTAMKLPIWIAPNVRVKSMYRGGIIIQGEVHLGQIRIGYHEADAIDTYGAHTILSVKKNGKFNFSKDAHIGHGAIINIQSGGTLSVGRNFAISGTTSIVCHNYIKFGDDVQMSWNSLITDSDAHKIFSIDRQWINASQGINIGHKVWIAANSTVLKGVNICDNTVVASNSLVNKKFTEGNCIIGGVPAKIIKSIGYFEI